MAFDVRRVVTGIGPDGRSNICFEGIAPNVLPIGGIEGAFITEIWVTEEMPVDNGGVQDRGARPIRHDPTPGGTIFRVVEIPPERDAPVDVDAVFASMGSQNRPSATDSARHPSMHFTNSVDYLVVISGEMTMLMEDGEAVLRQGDCIVQRGTKHGWLNRGAQPCILAAVLVDARPL